MAGFELIPGLCLPEETTLVSDPNKQTNKHTYEHYLSVRVTVKHENVSSFLRAVFDNVDYICYKHKGVRTKKEHVHVLVPDVDIVQKIRTRLARAGYKGNESFSIKTFHNGLSSGIQYASKENTEPIYVGEFEDIIRDSPKWVQKDMYSYTERSSVDMKKLRDWQLSYTNVVPVTVRYVQDNNLTSLSFFDAIDHLMDHTNWKISDKIQRCGIGPFQISDYERRLGKCEKRDTSWKQNWRAF